jgi:Ca-activated chloride channel family protein
MYWDNPEVLLLGWALPFVAAIWVMAHRRQLRAAKRFADHTMHKNLLPNGPAFRRWIKLVVLVVGLASLIAGAARPRWGVYFEEVQSRGVDIFVLLDVSRSMLAEDVAPNRLERAKSDIRDLVERLGSDRVGLIVFAGAAMVQVPLTTDYSFFYSILREVDEDSAPRGGSLMGNAIRKAVASLGKRTDRDSVIVIVTDGEDHESFAADAAREASARGIKIFAVGLGDTDEGSRIPVRDVAGNLTYLQHEGQEHWSQMNEDLLKEIAIDSGGAYIPARTQAYDLGQIYEDHLAGLTRGELVTEKRQQYRERYQLFLVIGIGLLLLEMSIPRYSRQVELKSGAGVSA